MNGTAMLHSVLYLFCAVCNSLVCDIPFPEVPDAVVGSRSLPAFGAVNVLLTGAQFCAVYTLSGSKVLIRRFTRNLMLPR
jgi:hypothetical protein